MHVSVEKKDAIAHRISSEAGGNYWRIRTAYNLCAVVHIQEGTHTHLYVSMCIASICITDISAITDMFIIPYVTRLREFYLSLFLWFWRPGCKIQP
jgi:hypothetical protein